MLKIRWIPYGSDKMQYKNVYLLLLLSNLNVIATRIIKTAKLNPKETLPNSIAYLSAVILTQLVFYSI